VITQSELKRLFSYDPETGLFTRLISNNRRLKSGEIAGSTTCGGYVRICVNGQPYQAHRLAWLYMTGSWPENQIDHINHIKDDNRIANLRDVTHRENQKNQPKRKTNTSGVTGVMWNVRDKRWRAKIFLNGKEKSLGGFTNKFEAICARKSAENRHGFHPNHGTK